MPSKWTSGISIEKEPATAKIKMKQTNIANVRQEVMSRKRIERQQFSGSNRDSTNSIQDEHAFQNAK